jgi:CRISPR-associated protein Csb2
MMLRVPYPGVLDEMCAAFEEGQKHVPNPMLGHQQYCSTRTRTAAEAVPVSCLAGRWVPLAAQVWDQRRDRPAGARYLPLRRAAEVCARVREALIKHSPDPRCELITGHAPVPKGATEARTGRSDRPHLAVLPLAFVGRDHSDGLLHGLALSVPEGAAAGDLEVLEVALANWALQSGRGDQCYRLFLGGGLELHLSEVEQEKATLRQWTWCRASTDWATVTPVALDFHPGQLAKARSGWGRAEAMVKQSISLACLRIGLPAPEEVEVDFQGLVSSVPPVRGFPLFVSETHDGKKLRRQLVHAYVRFAKPVKGPVALGAGRFRGMGLCLPMAPRDGAAHAS